MMASRLAISTGIIALRRVAAACRQAVRSQTLWQEWAHPRVRLLSAVTCEHRKNCHTLSNVSSDGKKLTLSWPDGDRGTYHSVWLRHSCQCPECWDPIAHMTKVYHSKLKGDITVQSATLSGDGKVEICWSYDEGENKHTGYIDLHWLRENSYSSAALEEMYKKSRPPTATSIPKINYSELHDIEQGLWKLLQNVNEFGVCVVTDVPTTPAYIKHLANDAGGLMETYYGETYQVVTISDRPKNLAFTTDALPLHMDMVNLESPPGLQFLHCMRNDECVEGGESVLVDANAVLEKIKQQFPTHYTTLSEIPATFQRLQIGSDGELVDHAYHRPHITLDKYGGVAAIYWNPGIQGTLRADVDDAKKYYEAFVCLHEMLATSDLRLYHRLRPGEVMTFNNRRMMHSRTAYKLNGGVRHLEGCYVSTDAFISKVRKLSAKYSPSYVVKSFFNEDGV